MRWRHLLVCALIGHVGIYGGVLNDAATVPDLAERLLPMWLLASLFAFVVQAGGWLLIPRPRRRAWQMDLLNLIALVPYAGMPIWSTTTSPVLSATLRSINLVPMMLWVCILGRLQFPFALAMSLAMLAGFVLCFDGPTALHQQIFWSNAKIFALAAAASLVTNFVLEQRERRTWLLRRIAARQRRAIEQAGEELRHLSMTDALTGVANRRRFEDEFDAACARRCAPPRCRTPIRTSARTSP